MNLSKKTLAIALLSAFGALSHIGCGGGDGDDDGNGSGNGGAGPSGGGTLCAQACDKLEQCSPGSVCTINGGGSCDGKAAEISQCILDKPCDQTNSCLLGGI